MSNHFFLALSVCIYLFYIFGLLILTFIKRKTAIKKGRIDYKFFKTYSDFEEPRDLAVLSRHVANQFELPPVFMLTVVLLLSFSKVEILTVLLAWTFVLVRVYHSTIHLGSNNILRRAKAYVFGWFIVLALWIQIMIHFLIASV
ncbi:MAG: MAPEG family protein [Bdellovibrionales bacterium]